MLDGVISGYPDRREQSEREVGNATTEIRFRQEGVRANQVGRASASITAARRTGVDVVWFSRSGLPGLQTAYTGWLAECTWRMCALMSICQGSPVRKQVSG